MRSIIAQQNSIFVGFHIAAGRHLRLSSTLLGKEHEFGSLEPRINY
jgi:hypothetical protein